MRKAAFTVIELLAAGAIVAVLSALLAGAGWEVYERSSLAVSAANIRSLAAGGAQYLLDHNHRYWRYLDHADDGVLWWWGFESKASLKSKEGQRDFNAARGPLAGYVPKRIQPDPSFAFAGSAFKPKYKNGYIGMGYNVLIGGGWGAPKYNKAGELTNPTSSYWALSDPSKLVVFATSAQVYPFSSSKNPKIEEFYGLDEKEICVHFRHAGNAMVAFANGSAGFLPMDESTRDRRMPEANIGRFAPKHSTKYLQ